MQGFILHTQKVRDEDLLVKVLTPSHLYTLYRFYGSRHSIIQLGNKIDFSIERDMRDLAKLREPMHLGFAWERDGQKRFFWQQYLRLLHWHLKDIMLLDDFYFEHLDEGARRLDKEEAKRSILYLYARLLIFEGRHGLLEKCLICEQELGDEIVLSRGMVCGHESCMQGMIFSAQKVRLWLACRGEFLDDEEIQNLWEVLMLGL